MQLFDQGLIVDAFRTLEWNRIRKELLEFNRNFAFKSLKLSCILIRLTIKNKRLTI